MTICQLELIFCKRYGLVALCVALMLTATACFRDASEVIEKQPVALEAASPTAVDTEVPTPEPIAEVSEEVEEIEEILAEAPPDTFALTATALISRLTESAAAEVAAEATQPANGLAENELSSESDEAVATVVPLVRETVPPGEDCIHEIRSGETLFMLSLAYGSTVAEIAEESEITDPDRISVGQRITIPGCGTSGFAPPPTSLPPPTSDPNAIAPTAAPVEGELVEVQEEEQINALVQQAQETILSNAQLGSSDDFSAQAAPEPTVASGNYTVQPNDSLLGIALQFGTTVNELAALNNITDINDVQAGDVIQLP